MFADFRVENRPMRSHAGIDDRDVDRARRKPLGRAVEYDRPLFHVRVRHVVRDIDDRRGRIDRQDHPFHRRLINAAGAEIGREGDDAHKERMNDEG
jgi:hypothetical protein